MHIETEEVGAGMQGMNKTQSESGFEKGRSWLFCLCCNQWCVSVFVHICSKSRLPQAYGYVGAECSTSFAQNIFKHSLNWVSGQLWNHHWHPQAANFLFDSSIICRSGVLLPFSPRAFSASAGERNTVVSLAWTYRRIRSTWHDTVMVTVWWLEW